MSKRSGASVAVLALAGLALLGQPAAAGAPAPGAANKEANVSSRATGTFDVKVTPIAEEGAAFGRMALDKQFHGDLEGTGKGEMMTAGTAVEGSAGYVAIERVEGSLRGRKGSFILMHHGTMQKDAGFNLIVVVLPDSGTGQLTGLTGKMKIIIAADRTHSYELGYVLPEAR